MKLIPTALVIALTSSSLQAKDMWFEVEVLMFERHNGATKQQPEFTPSHYKDSKNIELVAEHLYPIYDDCPTLSQQERFNLANPAPTLDQRILPEQGMPPRNGLINDGETIVTDEASAQTTDPLVPDHNTPKPEDGTAPDIDSDEPQTILYCHGPDETLLSQAYQIRAQRLADQAALSLPGATQAAQLTSSTVTGNSPENSTMSLDNQLNSAPLSASQDTPALLEDASLNQEDLVESALGETELIEQPIPQFDAMAFNPYPANVEINGMTYQVVPPRESEPDFVIPQVIMHEQQTDVFEKIHVLSEAQLEMSELRQKLRWQKSLKPILHTAWRQPVQARHLARSLRFFSGENYAQRFNQDGSEIMTSDTNEISDVSPIIPLDSTSLVAQEQEFIEPEPKKPSVDLAQIIEEITPDTLPDIKPLWRFDGVLKIYLNRFLFIETDFELRRQGTRDILPSLALPNSDVLAQEQVDLSLVSQRQSTTATKLTSDTSAESSNRLQTVPWLLSDRLKQNRRVRSSEIHYFDHPNFGMVIQIRRFKMPELQQND